MVIGRNGEIIFVDGIHRLAIVKILNLDEVPVIVNVWHENYLKKINTVSKLTPNTALEPILKKR